jgi:hypothetical protein
MVSVANDGTVLPFQAIYQGYSPKSCPTKEAPMHAKCINAGFRFEFSNTSTYWSNLQMMKNFVTEILAPYFADAKAAAGRGPEQKTIWQIDVWSVHRSAEFRKWMKEEHPTIILVYVPGGCTGIFQPCDVGIQRPFKLSTKKSYHEDIMTEFMKNKGQSTVVLDTTLPIVRDRSVRWLWNAWKAISNKALVKKV